MFFIISLSLSLDCNALSCLKYVIDVLQICFILYGIEVDCIYVINFIICTYFNDFYILQPGFQELAYGGQG